MRNFKKPTVSRLGSRITRQPAAGQAPEPNTVMNWSSQGVSLGGISYDNQGNPTSFGTGQPSLTAVRRP